MHTTQTENTRVKELRRQLTSRLLQNGQRQQTDRPRAWWQATPVIMPFLQDQFVRIEDELQDEEQQPIIDTSVIDTLHRQKSTLDNILNKSARALVQPKRDESYSRLKKYPSVPKFKPKFPKELVDTSQGVKTTAAVESNKTSYNTQDVTTKKQQGFKNIREVEQRLRLLEEIRKSSTKISKPRSKRSTQEVIPQIENMASHTGKFLKRTNSRNPGKQAILKMFRKLAYKRSKARSWHAKYFKDRQQELKPWFSAAVSYFNFHIDSTALRDDKIVHNILVKILQENSETKEFDPSIFDSKQFSFRLPDGKTNVYECKFVIDENDDGTIQRSITAVRNFPKKKTITINAETNLILQAAIHEDEKVLESAADAASNSFSHITAIIIRILMLRFEYFALITSNAIQNSNTHKQDNIDLFLDNDRMAHESIKKLFRVVHDLLIPYLERIVTKRKNDKPSEPTVEEQVRRVLNNEGSEIELADIKTKMLDYKYLYIRQLCNGAIGKAWEYFRNSQTMRKESETRHPFERVYHDYFRTFDQAHKEKQKLNVEKLIVLANELAAHHMNLNVIAESEFNDRRIRMHYERYQLPNFSTLSFFILEIVNKLDNKIPFRIEGDNIARTVASRDDSTYNIAREDKRKITPKDTQSIFCEVSSELENRKSSNATNSRGI